MTTFFEATHSKQVEDGTRFAFGENWQAFLTVLDEERIQAAESALCDMLKVTHLRGLRFLDVGSGSGLSSLAARRLGATVHSFDFDPASVACTKELKRRYYPNDATWLIQEGSALDEQYLKSLGTFDVVYYWGVLHHTGAMWTALANVIPLVNPNGRLFVALYNDQGWRSKLWHGVKQLYCSGPLSKALMMSWFWPCMGLHTMLLCLKRRENVFATYHRKRGMSVTHDWHDWLGGFPFEVASVKAVEAFYEPHGLTLMNLKTTTRLGNNQFVFRKER